MAARPGTAIVLIGLFRLWPTAALASTNYDAGKCSRGGSFERLSSRPACQALLDPGLSAGMVLTSKPRCVVLFAANMDRPDIAQGLPEVYPRSSGPAVRGPPRDSAWGRFGQCGATNRPPVSGLPPFF